MPSSKTSNKLIYIEADVAAKVLSGLDKISLPVIQTIGPLGKNVLIQDDSGNFRLTNDGVTIANNITVKDPIEDAVISIVKDAARRTNLEAGDGTSTTILLAKTLIQRSTELKKKGLSQRQIRTIFDNVSTKLLARLAKLKREVKDDKTLKEVATISANNDKDVAGFVVDTINTAGLDGLVVLDFSGDEKTTLEKQPGFRVASGCIYQNLYTDAARPQAAYKDIPVVMFDKALYYADEAEHILRVAKDLGYDKLVVVAKDFLGDSPNTFIANHVRGVIKLLLVKVSDAAQMDDIAVYLGGTIVSESGGRRVDSVNISDFVMADSIFTDPDKTLITSNNGGKGLKKRVAHLREELTKDKENDTLKRRIASLTNGVVTIKVGGHTQIEAREKAYRYEDAINAVRAAKKWGYLVGGGVSLFASFNPRDYVGKDERTTAEILARSSIEQIAENSMIELDYEKITSTVGPNASTGGYEDLLKAGVVEPFRATEQAIKNAVSVANTLTSVGTFITIDDTEEDKKE
jgi:chaperonin GroEL